MHRIRQITTKVAESLSISGPSNIQFLAKDNRVLRSTGPIESKAAFLDSARRLQRLGVTLYATEATARFLASHEIPSTTLRRPLDGGPPNAVGAIRERRIGLVVDTPEDFRREELANDSIMRRTAVDFGVPLITNRQLAERLTEALERLSTEDLKVRSWRAYR